jgi:large subunit ribosomal protein L6
MSRVGKLPITLPSGVTFKTSDGQIIITGPKGELMLTPHRHVKVAVADNVIQVSVGHPNDQGDRALWGLTRSLLANMVQGVTTGFQKRLEIIGVGYRAQMNGTNLQLFLGFSHAVDFVIPVGVTASIEKNVVTISGSDKQLVGETAAKIRALKKPEPYKGKGIKYDTEIVRRKAGKVVKAAGAK